MGRGIDRTKIFKNKADRVDFLDRLADLCQERALIIYAWALLPNHFHLLARTGRQPLSKSMRKLLTGYVVNFNRRHQRYGHLFQNRYKSIICEDDSWGKRDALLKFSLKSISPNYMGYETMKALKFILSSLLEIEIIGKRVSILID
jgi:REP element-mobilizing transposase RayT